MGAGADAMTDESNRPGWESDDALAASTEAHETDTDDEQRTEELVSEIDETRARMTDTVQAIGEKLDPHNVVQHATETVREATIGRVEQMASNTGDAIQQTGGGIVETIRSNPLPAAITAVGLWMLWKNRSPGDGNREWAYGRYAGPSARPDLYGASSGNGGPGVADRAREKVSGVADTVSGAADSVGQTVSGVTDKASQVPERAGEVAQRATSELDRILNENPLAVGAIALAAGAAAGLILPTTEPERRYLGEARDRVIEQAEGVAHQALDKVEEQAAQA